MIYDNCLILKGIGGFYYVKTTDCQIIECKARGVFRKNGITPLAGDRVSIDVINSKGTVTEIYERKNSLLRPPVANIDKLIIISSIKEPEPNLLVIDKLTALACDKNITPIIVFSKSDLADTSEYVDIYKKSGFESFSVSSVNNHGIEKFKSVFENSICALTGNTGVGKSSALNSFDSSLNLETSAISHKLGRGRHTTRSVELFPLCGGYIADTPGFSALELDENEIIIKDNLQFCFPEFEKYLGKCKFVSCSHIKEKGCIICDAVKRGEIPKSRHDSYISMYNDVKDYKEWKNK